MLASDLIRNEYDKKLLSYIEAKLKEITVGTILPYAYSGSLGAGAIYIPPAKTIVMAAYLNIVAKLSIMYGAQPIKSYHELTTDYGYTGAVYCDGVNIGFKNEDGSAQTLSLTGVTIS